MSFREEDIERWKETNTLLIPQTTWLWKHLRLCVSSVGVSLFSNHRRKKKKSTHTEGCLWIRVCWVALAASSIWLFRQQLKWHSTCCKLDVIHKTQTELKKLRCVTIPSDASSGGTGLFASITNAHNAMIWKPALQLFLWFTFTHEKHTQTRGARSNLERSGVPVQMVPPCVYSEGSYWVTADICCGDGGWLCRGGERRGWFEDGGGKGNGGSRPLTALEVLHHLNEKLCGRAGDHVIHHILCCLPLCSAPFSSPVCLLLLLSGGSSRMYDTDRKFLLIICCHLL